MVPQIIHYGCHNGLNQKFKLEDLGDGTVKIVSMSSKKVLAQDILKEKVQIWDYLGGKNQRWRLIPTLV